MAEQSLAARTAITRSREADYATDEAAALSTVEAHEHAALMHREAASWRQRAGDPSRALLHAEQANVHSQIAKHFNDDEGEVTDG